MLVEGSFELFEGNTSMDWFFFKRSSQQNLTKMWLFFILILVAHSLLLADFRKRLGES